MATNVTLEADIKQFEMGLENAIDGVMQNEVLEEVKDALQVAIEDNVYGAYESHAKNKYKRRGESLQRGTGALSDPDMMISDYDAGTHTLTVTDMATGGDPSNPKRGERLLAPIIESGNGYTWTNSEIYHSRQARPFHEEAERMLAVGDKVMSFEKRLVDSLKQYGFDVRIGE